MQCAILLSYMMLIDSLVGGTQVYLELVTYPNIEAFNIGM